MLSQHEVIPSNTCPLAGTNHLGFWISVYGWIFSNSRVIQDLFWPGPLEDEVVVLRRDLAHGYPEVAAPHLFVLDECEVWDQRLELQRLGKDCHRPDLHAEGEDLVAHLRRGGKGGSGPRRLGDDFMAPVIAEGRMVSSSSPAGQYEDGIAGLHPVDEVFVPPGYSPDVLL